MANNQMDGGSEEGTATNANSGASDAQSVQQPSFDAAKLQEVLDAVGTLSKRVDGLQSVKDKQTTELTGLKSKIAEYEQLKERLGSADSAIEQLELRETLSKMNQTLEQLKGSPSAQSGGTGASGAVNPAQAIRDAGLDENDPKVALMLTQNFPTEEEVNRAIVGYLKAKKSAPSPTQAQSLAETGEALKTSFSQQELNEMNNKLNSYYLEPTRYAKEIVELEKALEPHLPK